MKSIISLTLYHPRRKTNLGCIINDFICRTVLLTLGTIPYSYLQPLRIYSSTEVRGQRSELSGRTKVEEAQIHHKAFRFLTVNASAKIISSRDCTWPAPSVYEVTRRAADFLEPFREIFDSGNMEGENKQTRNVQKTPSTTNR